MKPSVAVCPVRSSLADSFRRKPRSSIASCTRLAVSGVTPGSPFTTRETVFSAPPALEATSFMVGRPAPRPTSPATAPAETALPETALPETALPETALPETALLETEPGSVSFTVSSWLLIVPPSYQCAQHWGQEHLLEGGKSQTVGEGGDRVAS